MFLSFIYKRFMNNNCHQIIWIAKILHWSKKYDNDKQNDFKTLRENLKIITYYKTS